MTGLHMTEREKIYLPLLKSYSMAIDLFSKKTISENSLSPNIGLMLWRL